MAGPLTRTATVGPSTAGPALALLQDYASIPG
jgi:hypothetical protein